MQVNHIIPPPLSQKNQFCTYKGGISSPFRLIPNPLFFSFLLDPYIFPVRPPPNHNKNGYDTVFFVKKNYE